MGSTRCIFRLLLAAILLGSGTTALGVPIHVDPVNFKGEWYIGDSDGYAGPATVEIPVGKHWVGLGNYVDTLFLIEVGEDGDVFVENGVSASGGANKLTLRTIETIVDPSGYDGLYFIEDIFTGSGKQTLALVPGIKYQLNVGEGGFRRRFEFSIDADGTISSENTESIAATGNAVRFLTTTVDIDPGGYEGLYTVYPASKDKWSSGKQSFVLPNGLRYRLQIGNEPIEFSVDQDGTLSGRGETSVEYAGNTIKFRTAQVVVDPGNYRGRWVAVRATREWWSSGTATLTLVTGVNYTFYVGHEENKTDMHIAIDGGVSGANRDSFEFDKNTIKFRNTLVTIDPAAFAGDWRLADAHPVDMPERVHGPSTLTLVPAHSYIIEPTLGDSFGFVVEKTGQIRAASHENATAIGSTLKFNTEFVEIAPVTAKLPWLLDIGPAMSRNGMQRLNLVPGVSYRMTINRGAATFRVSSPCKIEPAQVQIDSQQVMIACADARLDTDKDDIADRADNCPSVANTDQADSDGDRVGDACDDDIDGDEVANAADNCPDVFNAERVDSDGDGAGDACDDDADNDTIPNDVDNCPFRSNTDQRDRDGDGDGDACDVDIDKDGVENGRDNCPGVPNPDQHDANKNGVGDACDGDADSDGIENARDNCPLAANPDQADRDHDDRGDACDNDHDNDTVPDTTDNCPDIANKDQVDTDKDKHGDVCDDDADNDAVANREDNCPVIHNTDQVDADTDGMGDACDSDDDGDTIGDTVDNCPLVVNTDQRNNDGDKAGDACDDDIDGDGVANTPDQCPGTVRGTKVDATGCNTAQLIAATCNRADFTEPGRYVSCVARVAGAAHSDGLINDKEKWQFISGANAR